MMKTNILQTKVGNYELLNDYREVFDVEQFQERYVEEIYNKYEYIVGDISSEMLRLKGFYESTDKEPNIKQIEQYLNETCNYNTGYFILKRIKKSK